MMKWLLGSRHETGRLYMTPGSAITAFMCRYIQIISMLLQFKWLQTQTVRLYVKIIEIKSPLNTIKNTFVP